VDELIEKLIREGYLKTQHIIDAFRGFAYPFEGPEDCD